MSTIDLIRLEKKIDEIFRMVKKLQTGPTFPEPLSAKHQTCPLCERPIFYQAGPDGPTRSCNCYVNEKEGD